MNTKNKEKLPRIASGKRSESEMKMIALDWNIFIFIFIFWLIGIWGLLGHKAKKGPI